MDMAKTEVECAEVECTAEILGLTGIQPLASCGLQQDECVWGLENKKG